MKKLLFLFTFVCVISCVEDEKCNPDCMAVIISNALPVQFWLNGETAFNDLTDCRMRKVCFFQEFSCDDNIKIRIKDTIQENAYVLQVYNTNNELIESIDFTRHAVNPDVTLPVFPDFSLWANKAGNAEDWNIDSDPDISNLGGLLTSTFGVNVTGFQSGTVSIDYNVSIDLIGGTAGFIIRFYDGSDNVVGEGSDYSGSGTISGTLQIELTAIPYRVEFIFDNTSASLGNMIINSLSISDFELPGYDFHDVEFTGREYDLCDTKIKLNIATAGELLLHAEPNGASSLVNEDSSGDVPWIIDSDDIRVIFGSDPYPGTLSNYAQAPIFGGISGNVRVEYNISLSASSGFRHYNVTFIFLELGVEVATHTLNLTAENSVSANYDSSFNITLPSDFDQIRIQVDHPEEVFSAIDILELDIYLFGSIGNSDWISIISPEYLCDSKSIAYRNSKNFAGIVYQSNDYDYFYARFPMQFFHEDNPQESKQIELSTSEVITTSTNLKERRRILTDMMPDYMHRKLQLILAHSSAGSVFIDGDEWKINDAYERDDPPDANYPMKSASVYLTKKDVYLRNII